MVRIRPLASLGAPRVESCGHSRPERCEEVGRHLIRMHRPGRCTVRCEAGQAGENCVAGDHQRGIRVGSLLHRPMLLALLERHPLCDLLLQRCQPSASGGSNRLQIASRHAGERYRGEAQC
eukprot:scaffold28116_cov110-Isochrysis_galbana.AAC.3